MDLAAVAVIPAGRWDVARLAIAVGDPSGIGPEVLAKALASMVAVERGSDKHLDALLVGDAEVWKDAQRIAGVNLPATHSTRPEPLGPAGVAFIDMPLADRSWRLGEMSPAAGRASAAWFERAVRIALEGHADAVVFAPLNKQAMIRAGYPIRDEYDLCATLSGADDHDEMNVIPHPAESRGGPDPMGGRARGDLLWVARATSHASLREVPALLTTERVLRTIRLAHRVATGAGGPSPRIGVAALNPHAGEGGLMGNEETAVIAPAIDAARREGIDASGPHPSDHIFRRARDGALEVVVTMYHDQAQIATKLLGFEQGVSVGVGYPFVLVTPSHGTAFDIAGKGIADARPMRQALEIALRLVNQSDNQPVPSF
jgi:4-hydroxythreonine-4-phosphate dehydrogenase